MLIKTAVTMTKTTIVIMFRDKGDDDDKNDDVDDENDIDNDLLHQ